MRREIGWRQVERRDGDGRVAKRRTLRGARGVREIGGRQVARREGDGWVAKRRTLPGARGELARLASILQELEDTSQETKTKREENETKQDVKIIYR
jgi:hypothetical protein